VQRDEMQSKIRDERDDPAAAKHPLHSKDTDHTAQFTPARDSRNRRVPGLYVRNGRYYGQLWVDLGTGKMGPRRFPLVDGDNQPIRTLAAAKEALEIKRHERRERKLPTVGRKPLFLDYSEVYFGKAKVQRKRSGTLNNERQAIARWRDHLGHLRIDRIAAPSIAAYVDKRLKGGVFAGRKLAPAAERTVNLDILMLRNVLKMAIDDGHLRDLPRIHTLEEGPVPKRPLVKPDQLDQLLNSAHSACKKNGDELVDYLRFLAFSGAREQEALRVKWTDVDFQNQRVTIGSDGLAKNGEARTVEFNSQLGAHLQEMQTRRAPDCSWIFPSPQRGDRDEHTRSFRESFKLARKAAGLDWMGFHDLRHYFCSVCVMAGIDFMTIAAWLGHKDGGILVGKVYGHLLDEHRHKAAKLVNFGH
jgi:integrase